MWCPIKVLSRITSRHHWIIDIIIRNVANKIGRRRWMWNHAVSPIVSENAPIEAVRGHGLISTKWNGWRIISIFLCETFYLEGKCTYILRLNKRQMP